MLRQYQGLGDETPIQFSPDRPALGSAISRKRGQEVKGGQSGVETNSIDFHDSFR
jgi:hypothetical protein